MSSPKKAIKRKKTDSENDSNKIGKRAKTSKSDVEEIVDDHFKPEWSEHELLVEQYDLNVNAAKGIIKLFEEGNTIPFIARYRRAVTNNMTAEELRNIKDTYEEVIALKKKMSTVLKTLEKSKMLTRDLEKAITATKTCEELEHVYAPYKTSSKRTLAERAKELGLETPALNILHNNNRVNLQNYIKPQIEELANFELVKKGVIHILASIMATDTEILTALRNLRKRANFVIKTKKNTEKASNSKLKKNDVNNKFDTYADFEIPVKYIKPHQVLAINRGENLKVLSVKIVVPDSVFNEFNNLCIKKWLLKGDRVQERYDIIHKAIEDSYNRLVKPLIKREIRSDLKQKAERASCEVFSTNLKHLLLATPLKGKTILGIDPGFGNGCKIAVISPMGNVLATSVIYPHKNGNYNNRKDAEILNDLLHQHNCELIALGNGTACRQTEEWLTNLIQNKCFHPLDIKYTIVREDGASIYSCSPEAKKEFQDLDPNLISAVSLARRVQEPLAELIKIEPKHLGVGMYQHDVKKKQLDEALNDVVSECVSFVGVDLNTASQCLLKHVAGLSEKKAQQIINYRNKKGAFSSRKQLMKVSGIGDKIFQQCAGFLRVGPLTYKEANDFYKNSESSKLDSTNIHPESYNIASAIIQKLGLKVSDVGENHFISVIKNQSTLLNIADLCVEYDTNEPTIQLIFDALSKPLNYDFRNDSAQEPIFKKGLININDIKVGSILNGVVSNVTHFGCFVDVGLGTDGLIHVSKYKGLNLQIAVKVEVKVINVEVNKKRIGLEPLRLI